MSPTVHGSLQRSQAPSCRSVRQEGEVEREKHVEHKVKEEGKGNCSQLTTEKKVLVTIIMTVICESE